MTLHRLAHLIGIIGLCACAVAAPLCLAWAYETRAIQEMAQ